MVWADFAVLAIIGVLAVPGLFRGFVREAIALAGWIVGLWMAINFGHIGAGWFEGWVETPLIRTWLGSLVFLVAVLVVAGIVGRLAGGLVNATGLGGTDRVLGPIVGAGRGAIIVACLVLLAGFIDLAGFTDLTRARWWRESVLLPHFEVLAGEVARVLPGEIAPRSLR